MMKKEYDEMIIKLFFYPMLWFGYFKKEEIDLIDTSTVVVLQYVFFTYFIIIIKYIILIDTPLITIS